MRRFVSALCVFLFGAAGVGAQDRGGLTGIVKDPDGGVVANAPVRVKNGTTGAVTTAVTSASGTFELPQLAVGPYELTIPGIGFTFRLYSQKDIVVRAGQTSRLDIVLPFGGNFGTPGDDDSTIVRSRAKPISGPTPRMPDGKPDFSGVWNGNNDPDPETPSALPWAEAIAKERMANNDRDNPSVYCLPDPVLPSGPFFFKFVQTPKLMILLIENVPDVQQIFLDGREHPKQFNPSWIGHSIGRWEGDTLVVDTVGFNDKSWLGFLSSYGDVARCHALPPARFRPHGG